MKEQFTKPKTNKIDHEAITIECVEQQLKSMQLGYISHCFIVKGLEDDFDKFFDLNFKDVKDELIEKATVHAEKHIKNPEYLNSAVLKSIPSEVQGVVQSLLMINQKRAEIESNAEKAEVMKRNID